MKYAFIFLMCLAKSYASLITAGPALNFLGSKDGYWQMSAFICVKQDTDSPILKIDEKEIAPIDLLLEKTYFPQIRCDYKFLKYVFSIKLLETEQKVEYVVGTERESFVVPGINDSINMLYYSCNDLDQPGADSNWEAFLAKMGTSHIAVAGGDQIYNDGVFMTNTLSKWNEDVRRFHELKTSTQSAANDGEITILKLKCFEKVPLLQERQEIFDFYLNNYLKYWSNKSYRKLLSNVPSINMCDDHEFFDGFGSYPDYLQNSPMMQVWYESAQFFYLLFQQHTTPTNARNTDFFYSKTKLEDIKHREFYRESFSFLRRINEHVSLLALDQRGERTRSQIHSPKAMKMIKEVIDQIDNNCKHLLIMHGVPIVFPSSEEGQRLILDNSNFEKPLTLKEKLSNFPLAKVVGRDQFGFLEATDDMVYDHWDCPAHKQERNDFLAFIYSFLKKRHDSGFPINVTFLSGDIHLGALGEISFNNKEYKILQLISSGVGSNFGNAPLHQILELLAYQSQSFDVNDGVNVKMKQTKYNASNRTFSEWVFESGYFLARRNVMTLNIPPINEGIAVTLLAEGSNALRTTIISPPKIKKIQGFWKQLFDKISPECCRCLKISDDSL